MMTFFGLKRFTGVLYLNSTSGQYTAVMLSVEAGAPFSQDIAGAEDAVLGAWRRAISIRLPPELQPPAWPSSEPGQQIGDVLSL
jgi:hypothetical protein